jgi:DNA-binding CsgD family transcriptional regulator
MSPTEFYTAPNGEVMYNQNGQAAKQLCVTDTDIVDRLLEMMMEFYPEAYKAASEAYQASAKNIPYYRFLMARRFLKCNWGGYDNVLDIDHLGRMNFEYVSCPMRGECKHDGIICNPKFNTTLSAREMEVMQMCSEGRTDDDISTTLFISLNTVANHRKHSFRKLGLHNMGEFIRYANDHKLFKQ